MAHLRLPSRWWFDDDPSLFAYTSMIHNPVLIFTDPGVLRHFAIGEALVPMQMLSYWVDIKLAGFSPRWAYAHQVCSFLLTLLLLWARSWRSCFTAMRSPHLRAVLSGL